MVRVHGNWCGPDWTAGQAISVDEYVASGGDWSEPCLDKVDCACKKHDSRCVGGCSRSADVKFIGSMNRYLARPMNQIRHPIISSKARLMRTAIMAALLTRSR